MPSSTHEMTPEYWNGVAEQYDRIQVPIFRLFSHDALHLGDVRAGQRILDIAAGPGTLALLAAQMHAAVVATDFSFAMIERLRAHIAEEKLTNLVAEVMDGHSLALPDDSFDAAFSMFGLIYFADRAGGFREMCRVLRSGGIAVVAGWSANDQNVPKLTAQAVDLALPQHAAHATQHALMVIADVKTFAEEMRAGGFKTVRIETVAHEWTALVPGAMWQIARKLPAVARLNEPEQESIYEAFLSLLPEKHESGVVSLMREAHLFIGIK